MSKIRVRIDVWVSDDGICPAGAPMALVWEHTTSTSGDNPRYFGDELQRAVRRAADAVIGNAEVYVDLREDGRG